VRTHNPPGTSIEQDIFYISPNYDGVMDYLFFKTEVLMEALGWMEMLSVDGNDIVVERIQYQRKDMESELTFKDLYYSFYK
jgi:hypothetical protein